MFAGAKVRGGAAARAAKELACKVAYVKKSTITHGKLENLLGHLQWHAPIPSMAAPCYLTSVNCHFLCIVQNACCFLIFFMT